MIELDGQMYPSEVRQSQPVQLETQETPAGSSDFPGLSEELALGRSVQAGAALETGEFSADLDELRAQSAVGLGVGLRTAPGITPRISAANEGEAYDGSLADPAGSGPPLPRPEDTAPKLEAENLAWQTGEADAARALIKELLETQPEAKVLRFVRYPDAKRIMLVFHLNEEAQSLQRQY